MVYDKEQLKKFSSLTRKRMIDLNVSQVELADKVGLAACSVQKNVSGVACPTRKTMLKLAEVLGDEWLQESYKIGELAAHILLDKIESKGAEGHDNQYILKPELVIRNTT